MEKIDLEKINNLVNEEIKERGIIDDSISFNIVREISKEAELYDVEAFEVSLNRIEEASRLVPFTEVNGNVVAKTIKKITAKLCNFFVLPLVDHQSDLNDHYAKLLAMTLGTLQEERARRKELEKKLADLEKRLNELEEK